MKRRSTTQSRRPMETRAQPPASMAARMTVRPDSRIEVGPRAALGSTSSTALAKRRST